MFSLVAYLDIVKQDRQSQVLTVPTVLCWLIPLFSLRPWFSKAFEFETCIL